MKETIRVLLAEEHDEVRAGICRILNTASDIEVVAETNSGETVKSLICHYQPDVALVNIHLREINGVDTIRWINHHHQAIFILVLALYDDVSITTALQQLGATDVILKTASPTQLLQAIRNMFTEQNDGLRKQSVALI